MKHYHLAFVQYALLTITLHTHTHTAATFPAAAVWMVCFVLHALTVSGGLRRRMLKLKAQQAL